MITFKNTTNRHITIKLNHTEASIIKKIYNDVIDTYDIPEDLINGRINKKYKNRSKKAKSYYKNLNKNVFEKHVKDARKKIKEIDQLKIKIDEYEIYYIVCYIQQIYDEQYDSYEEFNLIGKIDLLKDGNLNEKEVNQFNNKYKNTLQCCKTLVEKIIHANKKLK